MDELRANGGRAGAPLRRAADPVLSWVLAGGFVAYAVVLLVGTPGYLDRLSPTDVLFNLPFGLAALAAGRAARRGGAAAPAWWVLATAMAVYLLANLVTLAFVADGQYPSAADALWLVSYGFAGLALVLLARSTITGVTGPAALDGLIAGTVAAAIATTLVVGRLLERRGGNVAVVVTNLAYPIADLLLLALLVTTTKLVSRADPVRILLAVGYASLFAGDCIFFWDISQGTWVGDAPPELFFVGAATFLGLAATFARPRAPVAAATPHLLVPAMGAVVCVGLLAWGQVRQPAPAAVALTLGSAFLIGIRVWMGVRSLRSRATRAEVTPQRLAQVAEARDGLIGQQIVAHFQPQVDLRTGEVIGAEVLARWHHPTRGVVGPDEFLPLLAEGALMSRLTAVMLDQAARALAVCAGSGHRMGLSVNLSTPELTDPELLATVEAIADATPEGIGTITLEITEESVIADPGSARAVLDELRRHGVRVSVDDYGTGHASLAYLRDLPLDEVKLDRSFVRGAWVDERAAAIAESTVGLAHDLDLSIVAEGIEDAETNSWLCSLGCDVGQGYFHARPMPLEELVTWLDDRTTPAAH